MLSKLNRYASYRVEAILEAVEEYKEAYAAEVLDAQHEDRDMRSQLTQAKDAVGYEMATLQAKQKIVERIAKLFEDMVDEQI